MKSGINFLILGAGLGEHALALKASRSPLIEELYAIPGNQGMASVCRCVDIEASNLPVIIKFIERNNISLAFIGDFSFLREEIFDCLHAYKIKVVAPPGDGGAMGINRVALRGLFRSRGIPLPQGHVFENMDGALHYCANRSFPVILKPGRKGRLKSAVCNSMAEVTEHLGSAMLRTSSGVEQIIIENFISGPVVAVCMVVVKNEILTLPYCHLMQNDKRVIGAYLPSSITGKTANNIERLILVPAVHALHASIAGYHGIITLEIAVTSKGPFLLDWDMPWSHLTGAALLSNMQTDIVELFLKFMECRLTQFTSEWSAATVALSLTDLPRDTYHGVESSADGENSPLILCHEAEQPLEKIGKSSQTVGVVANARSISEACAKIIKYWEINHFPENYDLYTALQIARESERPDFGG